MLQKVGLLDNCKQNIKRIIKFFLLFNCNTKLHFAKYSKAYILIKTFEKQKLIYILKVQLLSLIWNKVYTKVFQRLLLLGYQKASHQNTFN